VKWTLLTDHSRVVADVEFSIHKSDEGIFDSNMDEGSFVDELGEIARG
jgi:hypothetical protein